MPTLLTEAAFSPCATNNSGFGQIDGMRSFDRCQLNGKDSVSLTRDVVTSAQLVDNYIYMLTAANDGPAFYKMKIDKTDQTDLAALSINPACAQDGIIYYNGVEADHYLYALNTANDSISEVWAGNLWSCPAITSIIWMWKTITDSAAIPCPRRWLKF